MDIRIETGWMRSEDALSRQEDQRRRRKRKRDKDTDVPRSSQDEALTIDTVA